jgi:Protein of unknown function (DUF3089)
MKLTKIFLALLFFLFIMPGCSNKFVRYSKNLTFQSVNGLPDYSSLGYWAAHPDKKDPSDSVPRPLQSNWKDNQVDVFFLHPTTLTDHEDKRSNAPIDDAMINAKVDLLPILYQASVFNADARVFAPRYRQAHIDNFFTKDTAAAEKAFEIAYQDVRNAFEYYLTYFNNGRPFIIASHSQGTLHAAHLLKDFVENKPLSNKLVCAYLLGLPIMSDYFASLKPCMDSSTTGCFVSWRTLREGYLTEYAKKETKTAIVVNPLLWSTDTTLAGKELHKGAILKNFNKVYTHTNNAQIHGNVLWISKPKFFGASLYKTKNYHAGDLNLFYINLREDVRRRIGLYWK